MYLSLPICPFSSPNTFDSYYEDASNLWLKICHHYSGKIGTKLFVMLTHQLFITAYVHTTHTYMYMFVCGACVFATFVFCWDQYVVFGQIC